MYEESKKILKINLNRESERSEVDSFLKKRDLLLEKDVDYTLALYEGDTIIGTGSLSKNVIKCVAIEPNYTGEGLSSKLISMLINEQYERGFNHIFIFTKPDNIKIFKDFGFKEIITVNKKVTLLENNNGIDLYVNKLKEKRKDGNIISSIVMNCNPFTFGHQYLIEQASRGSDIVHIFVVWEDRSIFPNDTRYRLVQEGTKHLNNVIIHKGENYIISNSTFPSYFIKEQNEIVRTHALLDIKLFGEFIAPALGINRRYVGEEPIDLVTKEYNLAMKELLPEYNIDFIEIPRLIKDSTMISASTVRELIKNDKYDLLKQIVPSTTYEYLVSDEAKTIIQKIKDNNK